MEEKIDKPWGCEVIWAKTDKYVGKMLFIQAGAKLSLQYHRVKDETILVDKGRIKLHWFEDGDSVPRVQVLTPGESRHIPPGTIHRFEAIDNACVLEVSTTELDDVVRLDDDYGRETE